MVFQLMIAKLHVQVWRLLCLELILNRLCIMLKTPFPNTLYTLFGTSSAKYVALYVWERPTCIVAEPLIENLKYRQFGQWMTKPEYLETHLLI